MFQHTAGPWEWIDSETDQLFQFGQHNAGYPSLRTVKHYGEDKTEIRDGKSYTSFSLPKFILEAQESPENPGDAHLIAAAPELLAALEDLYEAASEAWGEDRPCVRYAQQALNKAKGITP